LLFFFFRRPSDPDRKGSQPRAVLAFCAIAGCICPQVSTVSARYAPRTFSASWPCLPSLVVLSFESLADAISHSDLHIILQKHICRRHLIRRLHSAKSLISQRIPNAERQRASDRLAPTGDYARPHKHSLAIPTISPRKAPRGRMDPRPEDPLHRRPHKARPDSLSAPPHASPPGRCCSPPPSVRSDSPLARLPSRSSPKVHLRATRAVDAAPLLFSFLPQALAVSADIRLNVNPISPFGFRPVA